MFRIKGGLLFEKTRWIPLAVVIVQVMLGIVTVLTSPGIKAGHWGSFEWMAQLHQLTGMVLLLSMVWILFIVRGKTKAI